MKKSMVHTTRISTTVIFLLIILAISNGCSKDSNSDMYGNNGGGSGSPGANEVWIQGMAFNPSSITIKAGTTIKWTNKDKVSHTVTSDTDLFDSGSLSTNATFSFKFETAGTYSYYCSLHPSMTAKVVVN